MQLTTLISYIDIPIQIQQPDNVHGKTAKGDPSALASVIHVEDPNRFPDSDLTFPSPGYSWP